MSRVTCFVGWSSSRALGIRGLILGTLVIGYHRSTVGGTQCGHHHHNPQLPANQHLVVHLGAPEGAHGPKWGPGGEPMLH